MEQQNVNTRSEQHEGSYINFWQGTDTFAIYRQKECLYAFGCRGVSYAALPVADSVPTEETLASQRSPVQN